MTDEAPGHRSVLLIEDVGPVRRLTMNRPDRLNALNGELVEALSRALAAERSSSPNHPAESIVPAPASSSRS